MNFQISVLATVLIIAVVAAQRGALSPLAGPCQANLSNVVCINKYAAVMPYPFERVVSRDGPLDPADNFEGTVVPNDSSFNLTKSANFILFDKEIGLKILGPRPSYEFVFALNPSIHEAAVYIPDQNKIIFSEFRYGLVLPLAIDLNQSPPTLSNLTTTPAVYGINGGRYKNGLVYWAATGSKPFANGTLTEPGILALNTTTNQVTTLLNNYFGTYFNGPNDLIIDSEGDIFFTDTLYGWQTNLTPRAPALEQAVYRFRPSTGAVNIIEAGLVQPNGIEISPDEKTIYITDTGAAYSTIYGPPNATLPPIFYNATGPRTIFAYDVRDSPRGKYVTNKRAFYLSQEYGPDGIQMAKNGYVLIANGFGYVHVISFLGSNSLSRQTPQS